MEKIDRIIQAFRNLKEDGGMMVGNAPGASGGFSGSSDPKGPTAGFDPVMGKMERRKKKFISMGRGSRGKWLDYLKNK